METGEVTYNVSSTTSLWGVYESAIWKRHYYRAMHFCAKRGIAIAYRLSVCLSVTMVDCDHIGWNSSKIISALVSLGCSIANAAEWLQIAQRPQWRAYRKLPSLFLMVPSLTLYNLSFAPKWGFHMPQHTRMAISLQRVLG